MSGNKGGEGHTDLLVLQYGLAVSDTTWATEQQQKGAKVKIKFKK